MYAQIFMLSLQLNEYISGGGNVNILPTKIFSVLFPLNVV